MDAIDVMVKKRIHRLVVTQPEGDKLMPVGVLSTTDIVREMRGSKWTWYV
jgi:predicted transcriptional regulator